MTRFFAIAVLLLAAGSVRAEEDLISDACVALDKNGDMVSDVVDDKGRQVFLHVDKDGNYERLASNRDPSAAKECAYVLCGGKNHKNHFSACKTGRKEPPPTPSGFLPSFLFPQKDMKVTNPAAGIGIRG